MEQDLVTIVVPVYKVERYLDRCVESLLNQTYQNLEIILIDDGSPDRCPQMCEEWAQRDQRIKVIHKENAGLGMARNTGIENATGRYVFFVDSDDYVAPEMVERCCKAAEEQNADVVFFGMTSVNGRGEVVRNIIPKAPYSRYSGKDVQEGFLPNWIDNRNRGNEIKDLCLSVCSAMFSMELIRRTGWRFVSERQIISEDSYSAIWLFRYMECVTVVEEAFYYYCVNPTSLTHTHRPDRYEKIKKFYEACLAMASTQGYTEAVRNAISGVTFSFMIAAMKQIVQSDLSGAEKKREIAKIVQDDTMKQILQTVRGRYHGWARNLLIFSMHKQLHALTYVLLELQVRRK